MDRFAISFIRCTLRLPRKMSDIEIEDSEEIIEDYHLGKLMLKVKGDERLAGDAARQAYQTYCQEVQLLREVELLNAGEHSC